ncbi:MAG: hypothetical protein ACREEI_13360, partial [Stellaceae bacterium]
HAAKMPQDGRIPASMSPTILGISAPIFHQASDKKAASSARMGGCVAARQKSAFRKMPWLIGS